MKWNEPVQCKSCGQTVNRGNASPRGTEWLCEHCRAHQAQNSVCRCKRGTAPVDWTEERPGVWKPATPEDAQTLEDGIEAALRAAGLPGLAELREATGNG